MGQKVRVIADLDPRKVKASHGVKPQLGHLIDKGY